jgi:hypothetical protein
MTRSVSWVRWPRSPTAAILTSGKRDSGASAETRHWGLESTAGERVETQPVGRSAILSSELVGDLADAGDAALSIAKRQITISVGTLRIMPSKSIPDAIL